MSIILKEPILNCNIYLYHKYTYVTYPNYINKSIISHYLKFQVAQIINYINFCLSKVSPNTIATRGATINQEEEEEERVSIAAKGTKGAAEEVTANMENL